MGFESARLPVTWVHHPPRGSIPDCMPFTFKLRLLSNSSEVANVTWMDRAGSVVG